MLRSRRGTRIGKNSVLKSNASQSLPRRLLESAKFSLSCDYSIATYYDPSDPVACRKSLQGQGRSPSIHTHVPSTYVHSTAKVYDHVIVYHYYIPVCLYATNRYEYWMYIEEESLDNNKTRHECIQQHNKTLVDGGEQDRNRRRFEVTIYHVTGSEHPSLGCDAK